MRIRILMALFVWLVLSLPGSAQDEAAETSAPPEDAVEAPIGSFEEALAEAAEDENADEDVEEVDPSVEEDFIFSEEIEPDAQLIFPVNI